MHVSSLQANLNLDRCFKTRIANEMDDEKLIIEVQKHQCLFNPKDKHYKNNLRRDNRWNEVGEAVGATGKQFYYSFTKVLKVNCEFDFLHLNHMFSLSKF